MSRAVANLSTLSEYCLPFVKKGGSFVSYKSSGSDEEIRFSENAVNILGGKIEKIEKFMLPDTDIGRALVQIDEKSRSAGKRTALSLIPKSPQPPISPR